MKMKTERSPEELAYVEARCNEARAILRRRPKPEPPTPEDELAALRTLLGVKGTEQNPQEDQ
jgi:hypothetical protein